MNVVIVSPVWEYLDVLDLILQLTFGEHRERTLQLQESTVYFAVTQQTAVCEQLAP